jgi:hypothetical protein
VGNAGEGKPSLQYLQHGPAGILSPADTGLRRRLDLVVFLLRQADCNSNMESFPWCTIGATLATRIRYLNPTAPTADDN